MVYNYEAELEMEMIWDQIDGKTILDYLDAVGQAE